MGRVFFARGINLGQKWWRTLWEEKFHAANGKAQACTQGALHFFPFKVWVGEGFFFLKIPWFPKRSHYVPFKFPLGSHYVPQTVYNRIK
jgi:hypothetical protein